MSRNIKLLSLFNFFIEFSLYTPIAIIYFSEVSGSYALGMSIFSITMISSAIFEVPTGIFSDLIGRKRTVVCGAISNVLAVFFYSVSWSYFSLMIGALFEGLGRSFYSGNNDAYLYDILKESNQADDYHHMSGKLSFFEHFGSSIIAIVGSIIAGWSLTLVMWLSIIPKIINLVISLFLTEPKNRDRKSNNIFHHLKYSINQFNKSYNLRLLSLSSIFGYAFSESSFLFRSAFVASVWPLWAVGFTNFISNVAAAFSFFISGRFINRFGFKKSIYFEIIFSRVTNLLALFYPTLLSPVLMAGTSIYYGISRVAEKTLLQKEFTSDQRATLGSLNALFGNILFGFVSVLLGLFADITSPKNALIFSNFVLILPIFLYQRYFSHKKL